METDDSILQILQMVENPYLEINVFAANLVDFQQSGVFSEYCRHFPPASNKNKTVVFGLKMRIDRCRNCHKK